MAFNSHLTFVTVTSTDASKPSSSTSIDFTNTIKPALAFKYGQELEVCVWQVVYGGKTSNYTIVDGDNRILNVNSNLIAGNEAFGSERTDTMLTFEANLATGGVYQPNVHQWYPLNRSGSNISRIEAGFSNAAIKTSGQHGDGTYNGPLIPAQMDDPSIITFAIRAVN